MFPELSAGLINLGFDPKFFESLPLTSDVVEQYGSGMLALDEAITMIVAQLR